MNWLVFVKATIFLAIVFVVSYFFALAKSDGAEGLFVSLMSIPAIVLGFPLLWAVVHFSDPHLLPFFLLYFLAIALDILLYAIVVEQLFFYVKTKRVSKPNQETS